MQTVPAGSGAIIIALSRLYGGCREVSRLKATQNFRDLQIELDGNKKTYIGGKKEINDIS